MIITDYMYSDIYTHPQALCFMNTKICYKPTSTNVVICSMLISMCWMCSGIEGLGIHCSSKGYCFGMPSHSGPGEYCERPVPSTVGFGMMLVLWCEEVRRKLRGQPCHLVLITALTTCEPLCVARSLLLSTASNSGAGTGMGVEVSGGSQTRPE